MQLLRHPANKQIGAYFTSPGSCTRPGKQPVMSQWHNCKQNSTCTHYTV